MSNPNSALAEIQQKYKNCNLLMPVSSEVQLNPFYKYTVMEVKADLSDNSGDIFKVGNTKVGKDIYADVYSPAKPLLMKLASAAGIQFDPNNTYGTYLSKNCYKAKAYGAMRMPDGTGKTHCDEKVINLEDEEDRFRLEFMDKSISGITEWRAAEAASKMFKGEWIDTGEKNEKGYPIKLYKIADEDRQKYIDRSVLVNMTLLRKTFAEKAMTGAILRVIRALVGLKGTYTKAELEKPFAIPRVTFNPDYSDPTVRRAMIEQGISSVGNMFGSSHALPASPVIESRPVDDTFNPEEFTDNAAFASEQGDNPANDYTDLTQDDLPPDDPDDEPKLDDAHCHACSREISSKVSDYAKRKFGRPLCMDCQTGGKQA